MGGKDKDPEQYSTISGSDNNLPISPKDSGVNTVPLSAIEIIFEKTKSLVRNDGLVWKNLVQLTAPILVLGLQTAFFVSLIGKEGSFKCDRSCINSRTKICEHVIAVVEKCGKLSQFVEWFRRSKFGASVSALALNGAPKSTGRKGNGRKRSDKKKGDIEEVVNMFAENEIENSTLYSRSPNNVNGQNVKAINEKHVNFHISDQPHFQELNNILSVHSAPPLV